ncbi:hypothetical protein P692DRAFT_20717276 [Suillus brevipes Sb2]|nr:hypothetical protein P692DRAFT_20717276 [Suillus brevipes Sb2]
MSSINASIGMTPFQLHLGRNPHVLPPLDKQPAFPTVDNVPEDLLAHTLISQLEHDDMQAQDNLLAAKASQAA